MLAVATTTPLQAAVRKDLYDIGEVPPLGHVPPQMHAWAIRKERHGPPETSMQLEILPTWPVGEDEVLVYAVPHRRFGRVRDCLGLRLESPPLESGR